MSCRGARQCSILGQCSAIMCHASRCPDNMWNKTVFYLPNGEWNGCGVWLCNVKGHPQGGNQVLPWRQGLSVSIWEVVVSPCSTFTFHHPSSSPPYLTGSQAQPLWGRPAHLASHELYQAPAHLSAWIIHPIPYLFNSYLSPMFHLSITSPWKTPPTLWPHVGLWGPCSLLPELSDLFSPRSYHTGL